MKKNHIIFGRTMRKYLLALIASLMATVVQSQTMTTEEECEFYQKAYDIIVEYSKCASLAGDAEREQFRLLFENTNVFVCNDLMGVLLGQDSLSVYRYMQELKNVEDVEIAVSNLHKRGNIVDNGDSWKIDLEFDKAISIQTKDYIYFDSKSFFKEDYHVIATITMEKGGKRQCYISKIRPNGEWPIFPEEYRVLEMREYDRRDNNLYINNERIKYNKGGQYILRSDDMVFYNRGKVDLRSMDTEGRKYQADYKDKHLRIRANMSFSLTGFNKVTDDSGLSFSNNREMMIGLDFGYMFKSASNWKTGIYAGIGLSKNSITTTMTGDIEKSVNIEDSKLDVDGDLYERKYKVWGNQGIIQKMNATDIVIPLYLDLEYQFTSRFSAYTDVGVRLQTTTAKFTGSIDEYETWGVYPDYGGLIIRNCDETGNEVPNPVDLNGFGKHAPQSIDVDEADTKKNMAFDVLAGLGVRINLNSAFAIDAGMQYIIGMNNSLEGKGKDAYLFSYDGKDRMNLLRMTDGIKHNALQLKASLIYKF